MGPRGFRRGRRRGLIIGAAVGSAAARRNTADDSAQAPAQVDQSEVIAELEKLAELKDRGILTEDEFQAKKQEILGV
jgi:hypothetical protein